MARVRAGVAVAAAAVLVAGGAALASGVVGGGSSAAPAVTTAPATAAATATTTQAAATPTATFDTSLPVGDPRRLPPPHPGQLAGVLLTGDGLCVPGIVDLAAPAPPTRIALHAPGCAVGQSPSGRYLATSTSTDPEGQPIVVLDTRTRQNRTQRRVYGGLGTGPPAVSDGAAVATCIFTGPVVETPRRTLQPKGLCGRIAADGGIAILQRDRRTLTSAVTGRPVVRLAQPVRGELPVLATSRTGKLIAALAFDVDRAFTFLTLYDRAGHVVAPRRQLTNAVRIRGVVLADDGRALALRSDVGWELFNLHTGNRLRQIGPAPIVSAAVAPDGSQFVAATPAALVFVDAATLGPKLAIPAQVRSVWWLIARAGEGRRVKPSTGVAVGVAGVVAVAAVASGLKSALDGSGGGTTAAAPAAGPTTTALPIGDVRRLPPLAAGDYEGRLVLYSGGQCRAVIVNLAHIEPLPSGNVSPACSVWVSPGLQKLATILPPPNDHEVITATAIKGRPEASGVDYDPGNKGALTVTDDGAVATCDGSNVVLGRNGRARTVRSFTPLHNGFDERCVTGAIGAQRRATRRRSPEPCGRHVGSGRAPAGDARPRVDRRDRDVVGRLRPGRGS